MIQNRPSPCRHSLFKKSSPAKKESMRAAGRRAAPRNRGASTEALRGARELGLLFEISSRKGYNAPTNRNFVVGKPKMWPRLRRGVWRQNGFRPAGAGENGGRAESKK